MDSKVMFKIGYGLYVLTVEGNGCIINTVSQVTTIPNRVSVTVNKQNYTHDILLEKGTFNVSILTTEVPFSIFERFGFHSGKDVNKFDGFNSIATSDNGVYYLTEYTNAYISGKVVNSLDLGTHTMFIADVTDCKVLSDTSSVTYDYYHKNIKPKPQPTKDAIKGYRCTICGYIYDGDTLPDDFVCPICKHGASDFEKINYERSNIDMNLKGTKTKKI